MKMYSWRNLLILLAFMTFFLVLSAHLAIANEGSGPAAGPTYPLTISLSAIPPPLKAEPFKVYIPVVIH